MMRGLCFLFFPVWVSLGAEVVPLTRAHAHNDYEHARPLAEALERGFCSVEADVWLVAGKLLVAHDLKDAKPQRTLESLYLDPTLVETEVVTPPEIYDPIACEKWLRDTAPTWPIGTVLVTGLGNYVHYGAHTQGLRLAWFEQPLDDRWTLAEEDGVVAYLPRPEMARLWRLTRGLPAPTTPHERDDPPPPGPADPAERMAAAMAAFNGGRQRVARAHLRSVIDGGTSEAEDARYFYAVSFFREDNWARASREWKHLLGHHPGGRWTAAAHWHLGICDLRRGRTRRARARFEYIVRRFPHDVVTVENARAELLRTGSRRGGLVGELWRRLHAPSG